MNDEIKFGGPVCIGEANTEQCVQQETYITAAQARELGVGKTEFRRGRRDVGWSEWYECGQRFDESTEMWTVQYRTIKQAQPALVDHVKLLGEIYGLLQSTCPEGIADEAFRVVPTALRTQAIAPYAEPRDTFGERVRHTQEARRVEVDPHATLRAEYAKQVAEGTRGFYLWEYHIKSSGEWLAAIHDGRPISPSWFKDIKYRCTDISCYVSKDGEPAIRMLRTEAQELQRKLGVTVNWYNPSDQPISGVMFLYTTNGIYNYRTKATIKLDGKMVTPERAAAEWGAKRDTHDVWVNQMLYVREDLPRFTDTEAIYELRTKQPKLKQLDWSRVPVGAMTNNGEFRGTYTNSLGLCADVVVWLDGYGVVMNRHVVNDLRLAPASKQKWIARQDGDAGLYEGLTYAKQYGRLCTVAYKVAGLADGYTDGSDV